MTPDITTAAAVQRRTTCDPGASASWLRRAVVAQFRRPPGPLGRLAGLIMALRHSNVQRSMATLGLLGIEPTDRVLEIGFGPGVAIATAASMAREGIVHGVDHSATMVAMATRRNAAAVAAGRVALQEGRVEDLRLDAPAFDKVYAVNVFHFWADAVAVLRRVRRCMSPGGRIAITHQPRNEHATNADVLAGAATIAADLRLAAFTQIESEVIRMRPLDAVCVLGEVGGAARSQGR